MQQNLTQEHGLKREHDMTPIRTAWLKFLNNFANPEHGPTELKGRAATERSLARYALRATETGRRAFDGLKELLKPKNTLPKNVRTFIHQSRNAELLPFLDYFSPQETHTHLTPEDTKETRAFYRNGLYGNYQHLLEQAVAQLALLKNKQPYMPETHKDELQKQIASVRGRITELIVGALVARLRHPNIVMVPALALQDSSRIRKSNHDYLYIDTLSETTIVQPVQVKTSMGNDPERHSYFEDIALVFGDTDLHMCIHDAEPCTKVNSYECLITTAEYLINEDTPEKTAALDTLTNGLLIKISDWHENPESWKEATYEHIRANQARRTIYERSKRRHEETRQLRQTAYRPSNNGYEVQKNAA